MAFSVKLLAQAVAADDSKTGYRLHLARAHRYAGNNDEAAKHLQEILKTAPDHVEAGPPPMDGAAAGLKSTRAKNAHTPKIHALGLRMSNH